MEANTITTAATMLGGAGVALTPAERASLPASLRLLRADNKFARVVFWGKIYTASGRDYYIAQGFGGPKRPEDALNHAAARSFYSHDAVVWAQLADGSDAALGEETARLIDGMTQQFSGDTSQEHRFTVAVPVEPSDPSEAASEEDVDDAKSATEASPRPEADTTPRESDAGESGEAESETASAAGDAASEVDADEDEPVSERPDSAGSERTAGSAVEPAKAPATRTVVVSEAQRLTRVVFCVDSEARIVPRGQYYMTADHRAVPAPGFFGLSPEDALSRESYMLLRSPRELKNKSVIETEGIIQSIDFLDTLSESAPTVSLVQDLSTRTVTLRSLVWPGAFAWHLPESNVAGYAYFGNGAKNRDLPFMM
jgi:hypothetical protein